MKIGVLGGGNVYALNFCKLLHTTGIEHFGIGRLYPKTRPFWVSHHYRYWALHLIAQFEAVLAVLDTERPDVIVNFAAQGEGQASFTNPVPFYQTNTVALVRLAEELRTRKYLSKFIQIGTSELYGSVERPSNEVDPIYPSSPYAVSKAAFDLHLGIMEKAGFPCTVVRPSNCYCPGQQLHRVIPKSMLYALSGKRFPLQGGGQAFKTYTHASDLSRAILILVSSDPGIYNCAIDEPVSIRQLVQMSIEACGKKFEDVVDVVPDRIGQDGKYHLDSSKLKALGWKAEIGLEEGLSEMAFWIRSYPELLNMSTDWSVRP